MAIKFKTDKEQTEWDALKLHNPKLSALIEILGSFCFLEFNKDVVITEIFRTQAEFDALYAQTPPEKRPPSSPHMRWEAVDIRSSTFTQPEIDKMLTLLNCFTYQGGQRKVAIYHAIAGNTLHFHIQTK